MGIVCLRSDFLKKKNSQIDIQIISSHSFCNSLQEVVNKQINENGHISIQKCAPNSSYYRIGGNIKGLKFLKWIYDGSTIYLNRKYNLYKNFRLLFT